MVADVNLYPLDPVEFCSWLREQQQVDGIAGTSSDDTDCPLARFLAALYGGSWAVHFSEYERLSDDLLYEVDVRVPLPAWAERFAFLVDWAALCEPEVIACSEALNHLYRACRENGVALEG